MDWHGENFLLLSFYPHREALSLRVVTSMPDDDGCFAASVASESSEVELRTNPSAINQDTRAPHGRRVLRSDQLLPCSHSRRLTPQPRPSGSGQRVRESYFRNRAARRD